MPLSDDLDIHWIDDELNLAFYGITGPFDVDGIRYELPRNDEVHVRPIFDVFDTDFCLHPYSHTDATPAPEERVSA